MYSLSNSFISLRECILFLYCIPFAAFEARRFREDITYEYRNDMNCNILNIHLRLENIYLRVGVYKLLNLNSVISEIDFVPHAACIDIVLEKNKNKSQQTLSLYLFSIN